MAEHIKLQCYRAIKRVPKAHRFYEQLMNEAKILKNLKHPNIPVIYDIEEDDNFSYIIEEYLEGQSLKAFRLCQSNIQEELVINFAVQICDLFQYIHALQSPILYLDLKPDNILVKDNILKLIDFGSAILREESGEREASFGTTGYAAPEQYGLGYLDERSDIYGIGVLLFFLVTKESYSVKKVLANCSKRLKVTIRRCLEYEPSQRYQDVTQLRKNLLTLQQKRLPASVEKSRKSLIIAIAGAQSRIGTTHISFLVTSYINQFIEKAIYVERNEHKVLQEIRNQHSNIRKNQEIYSVKKCPVLLSPEKDSNQVLCNYRVRICDYGVLSQDNIEIYGQADIRLLVLGTKEWEMFYSNRALKELIPYQDIYYLFNFMDGRGFLNVQQNMEQERCIRVPYYPDPFYVGDQGVVKEFIEEFFQEKENEKKTNSIKKYLRLERRKH